MKKEILICGATGQTGGAAVDSLLSLSPDKDIHISALVRDKESDKAKALAEKGVTLLEGSYDNKDSLKAAFEKIERCFLCCSNVLNQVELECNVIEAAEASGSCEYVVKISTVHAQVEGSPLYTATDSVIQYGQMHAKIEERLAASKLKYTVLAPNYFMQNFVGDIFATLPQKMVAYPHQKNNKAAVIDTRDIGAVGAKLLLLEEEKLAESYHGKVFNVCGPKSLSIQEIVEIYSKNLKDTPIQFIRCSSEQYAQALEGAGFPDWMCKAVANNHTVFWDNGGLDFECSPEIKELLPKWRTMEEWVSQMAPMVNIKFEDNAGESEKPSEK